MVIPIHVRAVWKFCVPPKWSFGHRWHCRWCLVVFHRRWWVTRRSGWRCCSSWGPRASLKVYILFFISKDIWITLTENHLWTITNLHVAFGSECNKCNINPPTYISEETAKPNWQKESLPEDYGQCIRTKTLTQTWGKMGKGRKEKRFIQKLLVRWGGRTAEEQRTQMILFSISHSVDHKLGGLAD